MSRIQTFLFLVVLLVFSCTKPPDYPDTPVIEFVSMSKTSMMQGNTLNDSLSVIISFTDGDGDIAGEDTGPNIELRDSRNDGLAFLFKVPEIPNSNSKYGLSGTIKLAVYNDCCQPPYPISELCTPLPNYTEDELYYTIVLRDRAGNVSNEIQTEMITLRCD